MQKQTLALVAAKSAERNELTLKKYTISATNHVVSLEEHGTVVYGVARAELRFAYNKKLRATLADVIATCGRDVVRACMRNRHRDPERLLSSSGSSSDLMDLCFPEVACGMRRFRVVPLPLLPLVLARLPECYRCAATTCTLSSLVGGLVEIVEQDEALTDAERALLCADIKQCCSNRLLWGPLAAAPSAPVAADGDTDDETPGKSASLGAVARYDMLRRRDAQSLIGSMLLQDRSDLRVVCTSLRPSARELLHKAGALPGWHIELEVEKDEDAAHPRTKRRKAAAPAPDDDSSAAAL